MHQLGVKSGQLLLETKYYSCSVPVEFGNVTDSTKAVVVLEDLSLLDKIELDDDCVKLVFSECGETKLHACIDRGFELVLHEDGGVERVLEALKCRVWSDEAPENLSSELLSFEALLAKMTQVRSGELSDTERRAMAESIASEFLNYLDE